MAHAKTHSRASLPARKPMASVRRVSLFEREIRVRLSTAALDILFELAAVLSEGHLEDDGYYGSTMITIDLARAAVVVSDACDAGTARRVTDLLEDDPRVRARAEALALAEAEASAGCRLSSGQVDIRVRSTGAHVHIDVDVEATEARVARA